jgi:hypothetical protein
MQLNPPLERDAGVTNTFNARYTIKKYAKAIKEYKE